MSVTALMNGTNREQSRQCQSYLPREAAGAMTAAELSRGFKKGGKRIEQRVTQVLDTLAKYGRVTALPNGAFSARRAA